MNLNVIVAYAIDRYDSARATNTADVGDLSRFNQRTRQADDMARLWAEGRGGKAIESGGGKGSLEVCADHLHELPQLKDQINQEFKDSTVSFGVGKTIEAATEALQFAQTNGGNEIELFTEELHHNLNSDLQKSDRTPFELYKADDLALNKPAAGGGMTGPSMATPAAPEAPVAEGSEHSENEALRSMLAGQPPPADAPDLMSEFSQLASESEGNEKSKKEAQVQEQQGQEDTENLKKQIVEILKEFQAQGPLWEQLKEAQPDAYKTLVAMMQSMIEMARELFGVQMQKSEAEPLEKMALIHKDDQNPKYVWSVQNERGEGPYAGGAEWDRSHVDNIDETNPIPHDDFGSEDLRAWLGTTSRQIYPKPPNMNKEYKFGFEHPDHAKDWFGETGLAELANQGFTLKKIPAREIRRPYSGKQVMYLPHVTKKSDLMPGGKGDNIPDSKFDLKQLALGIATEMEEHGLDKKRAKEVAKDHLVEDPNYYALEKGLPRDDIENQVNTNVHDVYTDSLEEQGFKPGSPNVRPLWGIDSEKGQSFMPGKGEYTRIMDSSKCAVCGEAEKYGQDSEGIYCDACLAKLNHGVGEMDKIGYTPTPADRYEPSEADLFDKAEPPLLHSTVDGFLGQFKSLPKDSGVRGKFITQHMNHGPFLSALQAHPQGKQIHSMLTQFLNSKANAGVGVGAKVMAKAWPKGATDTTTSPDNEANAHTHAVMEDALLEHGARREEVPDRNPLYSLGTDEQGKVIHKQFNPGLKDRPTLSLSRKCSVEGCDQPQIPMGVDSFFCHGHANDKQLGEAVMRDIRLENLSRTGAAVNQWDDPGTDEVIYSRLQDHLKHPLKYPPEVAATGVPTPDKEAWAARSPILKRKLLNKAALEPGKTGRHNVVLPVGSQLDASPSATRKVGRIKIFSPSAGKTKWRSVRAGQVMDPEGNPTSSRNPSGGVDRK